MPSRLVILIVLPVMALAGCGTSHVDTASYTCGDFNKSLKTKGDDSAGTFIRDLRGEAKLGQSQKTEEREITAGIIFACRNEPASTKPRTEAISIARKLKAGTFKAPAPPAADKKKSTE